MKYEQNESTIWTEINRKDFKGEYPFKADSVIVRCMDRYLIAVGINGETYALNGSMQNHIKGMKTPFDDGLVIKRKSVADVISFGLDLWNHRK